jgi:hypothetical protein
MLRDWTTTLSKSVERLRTTYMASIGKDHMGWEAAHITKGLPVHCDIGGCLILTSDGRVLEYASYDGAVKEVADPVWIERALEAAASKFPELTALKPQ